jgi:hypothetical protein
VSSRIFKAQKIDADMTDARVAATTNVFESMDVVKFYAWESSFATLINECRKQELDAQFSNALWQVLILVHVIQAAQSNSISEPTQ